MIKKGFIVIVMVGVMALSALVACQSDSAVLSPMVATVDSAETVASAETVSFAEAVAENSAPHEETTVVTPESAASEEASSEVTTSSAVAIASAVTIALNGDSISADDDSVVIDGNVATITAAGSYSISGPLADGQIIVDTEDEAAVTLILNGVDISSSTSAPIAVMSAGEAVIVLADNTANFITDAAIYVFPDPEEDEPNAAIFSNDDLTITGNGSLSVTGNYNDAISTDDGLIINSGTIAVNAVDDGIRGKDYLVVKGGAITVNAGDDGLKSDHEDDAAQGYILIENGVIDITAGGDAIQAETDVLIAGGEFALMSGGGSNGRIAEDDSAKGIKGGVDVHIAGGTFTISSADDAVHSNGSMTIDAGVFTIATGDDGLHADASLTINGGDLNITQSYEGIEGSVITINAGDIRIVASDDGINVAGGADGSGMMAGPERGGPGRQGGDAFTYSGSQYLYINGGYIVVNAAGDGIDVNGAIEMTGGVVLVNGPTEQMNAALDYDATFNISGGFFVAAGSAGMAMAPGQSSGQNSLLVNFNGTLPGGTLVNIQNATGESLLTFAPAKDYQSITFSSPDLVAGDYTLYYGGSATGTNTDGLYTDGTYTPGTEYTRFTVSSTVTAIGAGGFRR